MRWLSSLVKTERGWPSYFCSRPYQAVCFIRMCWDMSRAYCAGIKEYLSTRSYFCLGQHYGYSGETAKRRTLRGKQFLFIRLCSRLLVVLSPFIRYCFPIWKRPVWADALLPLFRVQNYMFTNSAI